MVESSKIISDQQRAAAAQQQTTPDEEREKRVKLACFSLKHDDFVHDVQFDHYGRRIATCSSDQNIKIWERTADLDFADTSCNTSAVNATGPEIAGQIDEMLLTNQWVCTFQIQSKHNGAIWRIAWADPEFGQIIASCGMDQHVFIFKERESGQTQQLNKRGKKLDVVLTGRIWDNAWKTDINAPIEDIKFAPKSLGLVLAVACSDGSVSFFAPAQGDQLNDWQPKFVHLKKFTAGCNCLAWNPAFDEKPMILCGYQESMRQQNRAIATSSNGMNDVGEVDPQDSQLLLYRLSGTSNSQQFVQYGTQGQFKGHAGSIHDIAWAPLAGRSFHMVATSATDKRILIWRLQVVDFFSDDEGMFDEPQVEVMFSVGAAPIPAHPFSGGGMLNAPDAQGASNLIDSAQANGQAMVYQPNVLRLKWNVTGTCFAGSAEDGTVSVWQRSIQNPKKFTKVAGIKSRS